jgi:DNA-binding MarR family transcriptional regulator
MSPHQRSDPRDEGPQDRLRAAVQTLFRQQMRQIRETATEEGLTLAQMFVLRRVHRAGTVPATSWAREEGVTASSLSSVVDGLVEDGFLKRSREDTDRRVVQISLTPKGARLAERLESEQKQLWNGMTREMGARELNSAAEVLERLAGPLHESPPVSSSPPGPRTRARRST